MAPLPAWVYETVVAPLVLGLALHHAWRALGLARALGEIAALAAYGYALERAAIAVFRSHEYGPGWAWAPGGVPVAVAVVWAAVLSAAMAVAGRRGLERPLHRAGLAALVGISLDLLMEPVAVRRSLWRWTPPGAWLGVPIGNSVGWGVIVGGYVLGAERWAGATGAVREALRRVALAAAAVGALMAVGGVWRGLALEGRFDARTIWVVWSAVLLGTLAAASVQRPPVAGSGSLVVRLGQTAGPGPAAVFLLLAATFAWDAAALADRALAVVALGTVVTLAWATRPADTVRVVGRWRRWGYERFARVEGFVRVLMKPRNGVPWTPEDRRFLREALVELARWTPAFVLFLLPGGMLLLAVYAWLLDRRHGQRTATPPQSHRDHRAGATTDTTTTETRRHGEDATTDRTTTETQRHRE
jgi:uncharacterized membrane protein